MKEIISRNLKMLRSELDLTQKEFANYLGLVSRESVSQYENAEREVPLEVLEKCCDIFGVELIDFFEENEETVKTSIHFAYRADNVNKEDLEVISQFKKIIKNYQRMKRIINNDKLCN